MALFTVKGTHKNHEIDYFSNIGMLSLYLSRIDFPLLHPTHLSVGQRRMGSVPRRWGRCFLSLIPRHTQFLVLIDCHEVLM